MMNLSSRTGALVGRVVVISTKTPAYKSFLNTIVWVMKDNDTIFYFSLMPTQKVTQTKDLIFFSSHFAALRYLTTPYRTNTIRKTKIHDHWETHKCVAVFSCFSTSFQVQGNLNLSRWTRPDRPRSTNHRNNAYSVLTTHKRKWNTNSSQTRLKTRCCSSIVFTFMIVIICYDFSIMLFTHTHTVARVAELLCKWVRRQVAVDDACIRRTNISTTPKNLHAYMQMKWSRIKKQPSHSEYHHYCHFYAYHFVFCLGASK